MAKNSDFPVMRRAQWQRIPRLAGLVSLIRAEVALDMEHFVDGITGHQVGLIGIANPADRRVLAQPWMTEQVVDTGTDRHRHFQIGISRKGIRARQPAHGEPDSLGIGHFIRIIKAYIVCPAGQVETVEGLQIERVTQKNAVDRSRVRHLAGSPGFRFRRGVDTPDAPFAKGGKIAASAAPRRQLRTCTMARVIQMYRSE